MILNFNRNFVSVCVGIYGDLLKLVFKMSVM